MRSLYTKLVVALLGLLGLLGASYVGLTLLTNQLYLQEANQKLNQDLAAGIVRENLLMEGARVNQEALEGLFHTLMVINPSIEVYLVNPSGRILAYSAPPGKVKRQRISLVPVSAFLDGRRSYPVLGDDPRHPGRQKVFSAAPIMNGETLEGYLYIVLGGEAYESVLDMLHGSYVTRLSAGAAAASLVITLGAGNGYLVGEELLAHLAAREVST